MYTVHIGIQGYKTLEEYRPTYNKLIYIYIKISINVYVNIIYQCTFLCFCDASILYYLQF